MAGTLELLNLTFKGDNLKIKGPNDSKVQYRKAF